jgi:phage terminase large subunit-like protein
LSELWLPTTYTKPLSENFVSDGPKLREFASRFWATEEQGLGFKLLPWQEWVIDHALERYPEDHPDPHKAGRLRKNKVVISVARQNGKSTIGSLLTAYGLFMHETAPNIVCTASTVNIANNLFNYIKAGVQTHPAIKKRFKVTGYQGIKRLDKPGRCFVRASDADRLQGQPFTLGIVDELHLLKPEVWQAITKATMTKKDGIVIGLTTAGDNDSELLKRLYEMGHKAAAGSEDLERFGFYLWEGIEGAPIDDEESLRRANPSVVCGLVPMQTLLEDVRTDTEVGARRFSHNRFITGSEGWLDMHTWLSAATGGLPEGSRPVFVVDRTPGRAHASVTAVAKLGEVFYTELAAVITDPVEPTDEVLLELCKKLNKNNPLVFVMDKHPLGELAKLLEMNGLPVKTMQQGDIFSASEFANRQIKIGRVSHSGDARVTQQIPNAKVKQYGERWRLVRNGSGYIDTVLGMMFGIWVAETYKEVGIQLF